MSYSESKVIDQITISEGCHVSYRIVNCVLKDGEIISKTFHRNSLLPGQDLTDQPKQVADVCNLFWTEDVVAAYKASIQAGPFA